MSEAAQLPVDAVLDGGRIPVLDIGRFLAGEPDAAAPLARAVARTCEDTGFLVVANHGVAQRLVDATFAAAAQFFARPEAEKLALKVGKYNIGYLPFGGQVVRHSPVTRRRRWCCRKAAQLPRTCFRPMRARSALAPAGSRSAAASAASTCWRSRKQPAIPPIYRTE